MSAEAAAWDIRMDGWSHWLDAERIVVNVHIPVSYTHLRAHETVLDLVCRLLLEKKKPQHVIIRTPVNHRIINNYQ